MNHGGKRPADAAARKRRQRAKDAKEGLCQVCVRVPKERAAEVREIAAGMLSGWCNERNE